MDAAFVKHIELLSNCGPDRLQRELRTVTFAVTNALGDVYDLIPNGRHTPVTVRGTCTELVVRQRGALTGV